MVAPEYTKPTIKIVLEIAAKASDAALNMISSQSEVPDDIRDLVLGTYSSNGNKAYIMAGCNGHKPGIHNYIAQATQHHKFIPLVRETNANGSLYMTTSLENSRYPGLLDMPPNQIVENLHDLTTKLLSAMCEYMEKSGDIPAVADILEAAETSGFYNLGIAVSQARNPGIGNNRI